MIGPEAGAAWLKLGVDCEARHVEAVSNLLERYGAESISISPLRGEARFGGLNSGPEYWVASRVSALLPADADLDVLVACLRNAIGTESILGHHFEAVPDQDWVAAGRSLHGPMRFGDVLCVCPGWAEPLPARHVITLDPGLAFGSGSHDTTALCLEWLVTADLTGKTVIDYGCGSGILGIAAALLGAGEVRAVDIDPQAVAATTENARRNGVARRVSAQLAGERELPAADLVLANILLEPLLELAETFARLVRPGGNIALSGILAVQAQGCLERYARWFTMATPAYRNEWALLHGVRNDGTDP
jgi:ribosomal protein L11 methyltransferase